MQHAICVLFLSLSSFEVTMTPKLERILRFAVKSAFRESGSLVKAALLPALHKRVQPGIQWWWHQSQEKNDNFLLVGCFSTTKLAILIHSHRRNIQDTSRFDWCSALSFLFRSSGFAQELMPVRNVCLSVLTVSNWTKLPQLSRNET